MIVAGYKSVIKKGGVSTAFVDIGTTNIKNNIYQITDKNKRILDPNITVIVKVNAVKMDQYNAVSKKNNYELNYLKGTIDFLDPQTDPVTVSGQFIPLLNIGCINQFALTINNDILDKTCFNNVSFKSKKSGLKDISLTITDLEIENEMYFDYIKEGKLIFVYIKTNESSERIKSGWFIIESMTLSSDLSSLTNIQVQLKIKGDQTKLFSWR